MNNKIKGPSNKGNKGNKVNRGMRGKQGRKDSRDPRVNYDNARKSKVEEDIDEGMRKPGANSISDFNRNPAMLKAAGNLPFASILGERLGRSNETVPGIMTAVWYPSFGGISDIGVINKCFQQMYNFVVHGNSRNYKYEYTDLAMFTLAGADVFSAIMEMIRVYGCMMQSPEENRYLPRGLVNALGWDYDDLQPQLNYMYFDILNLIQQTKGIWVPNTIPLLTRWIEQNAHVYTDAPGKRSQIYVKVRGLYYTLSQTGSDQGTCLLPATIPTTGPSGKTEWDEFNRLDVTTSTTIPGVQNQGLKRYKWSSFKAMVQKMITNLTASQDRGTIYGDIAKAYGSDKIFAMPSIDINFTVAPEYNAEILMQFENLTTVTAVHPEGLVQTMQDVENRLIQTWTEFKLPDSSGQPWALGMPDHQILNFHIPNDPNPELIMLATRGKCGALVNPQNTNVVTTVSASLDADNGNYIAGSVTTADGADCYVPTTCGTELYNAIFITYRNPGSNYTDRIAELSQYSPFLSQNSNNKSPYDPVAFKVMAFDWHPFLYNLTTNSLPDQDRYNFLSAYGDFDNYILIDDVELSNLNLVALYSVLGMPHLV